MELSPAEPWAHPSCLCLWLQKLQRSTRENLVFWPDAGLNTPGKAGVRAPGWAEGTLGIWELSRTRRKVDCYGFQSLAGSQPPAAVGSP